MDRFEEVKERVKEANDLVATVEAYLPLRRSGRNLTALCPFHQEKTPSFTVYPDSQHFKCYGCGRAGDVFTFVMEREGLGFRECMEMLAQRAGISLEGVFGRRGSGERKRVDPHAVLATVALHFQEVLRGPDGERARRYLADRGLQAGVEPFGLGAHPTVAGALHRLAREQNLPLEVLEQAGLVREGGREPFRGRLMFPIEDERGRVVGFGGRLLEPGRAKYINSPESPFFRKRRVLYGLRQVKDAGQRRVVVMEGYTDVIACHLAGHDGAVATLGTSLTREHGGVLSRWATDGVVLLFDGDTAGRGAAEKAYGELVRTELAVRTALLPEGTDPADLVTATPGRPPEECERGRQAFAALVEAAEDALETWFRIKRARMDLAQEANVLRVVDECAEVLAGVDDPAQRAVLQGRMARHLGLDEGVLRRSLQRRARRPARAPAADADAGGAGAPPEPRTTGPMAKSHAELLACVLAQPDLVERARAGLQEAGDLDEVLAAAAEAVAGGADAAGLLRALFTRFAERPAVADLLAAAADLSPTIRDATEAMETLLRHRQAYLARREAQQTRFQLQQARAAGNGELVDELTRRYVTLLRRQHD